MSAEVAATYKHSTIANVGILVRILGTHLPELGEEDTFQFGAATVLVAGSVWTHAHPSAAMLAAYEADPELAAIRLDFTDTMRGALEVFLRGLLARAAD
ncbi:hypothetical protein [Streptodolium elevatio]